MKDMVFLSQKVDGKMIFTDYWKVLLLNFSVMGNTVFFESRSWSKDNIYRLLRNFSEKRLQLRSILGNVEIHGTEILLKKVSIIDIFREFPVDDLKCRSFTYFFVE